MDRDLTLRNEIECRFDGPLPPDEVARARWHASDPVARALGERLMWAAAVRNQIRSIRALRRIGGTAPHLAVMARELTVLRLYFQGANRAWRALRYSRLATGHDDDTAGDQ